MSPDLKKLISYTNERICFRYEKDNPFARMSGKIALRELMKFFWLCKKHKQELQA